MRMCVLDISLYLCLYVAIGCVSADYISSMNRILVVSYYFPPVLSARSIQVAKFVKYVNRSHYRVNVVTANLSSIGTGRIDEDLNKYLVDRTINVTRAKSRYVKTHLDVFLGSLTGLYFLPWIRSTFHECLCNMYDMHFEALCTFSSPFDSHLVGLLLKRKFGNVRWVACFSDPFVNNPFVAYYSRFLRRGFQSVIERLIVKNADVCVFVSHELMERIMCRYPIRFKNKCRVIPHCYDDEIFPVRVRSTSCYVTLRYIGDFCRQRSLQPLVAAIRILKQQESEVLSKLKIEIVGQSPQPHELDHFLRKDESVIRLFGPVSYPVSLELMVSADYLLVIDASFERSPFFPSKIVDYLGSKRPIIGITPLDSCTARILLDLGHHVVPPNEPERLAQLLTNIVMGRRAIKQAGHLYDKYYSCKNVVQKFIEVLTSQADK